MAQYSHLPQLSIKINGIFMAANLASLVVEELGLTDFEASTPTASLYGVTQLEIKSGDDLYRVYLVKDSQEEVSELEESAKLAAFYNSQFTLRALHRNKNKTGGFPCGEWQIAFQIEDNEEIYSVFVIKSVPSPTPTTRVLSLEQLTEAAVQLAKLHSVTSDHVTKELHNALTQHHGYVAAYDNSLTKDLLDILTTSKDIHQYFKNPEKIKSKMIYLMDKCAENPVPPGKFDQVIVHGRLNSEFCRFNGDKLVEITNWEKVHFSDPATDLTYLILLSAKPEVRRKGYMEIFRHYYFQLIDSRPVKFKLSDIRDMYKFHQKQAVVAGMESLLEVLLNSSSEEEKSAIADIWENALQDAYEYETNDNDSDDEHCLFR